MGVIYTAHHASHSYAYKDFDARCALTPEERVRFSDYGTDVSVPKNGTVIVAPYARGIVDLNRGDQNAHDKTSIFPTHDYARPERNAVWKQGMEPTPDEHMDIRANVYDAFHQKIMDAIAAEHAPTLIVSWDNTAQYAIGKDDAGIDQDMKPFILSNRGIEGGAARSPILDEETSCDPEVLLHVAALVTDRASAFGFPNEVFLNYVYKGGYITRRYSSLRHSDLPTQFPVQSFQVEYSTALTHDQSTLEELPGRIEALSALWTEIMDDTYRWWLSEQTHVL